MIWLTREDVIEYLNTARRIDERISSLKEALQKNYDKATKITQSLDITGVRCETRRDTMSEYVAYAEETSKEIKKLVNIKADVSANVNKLKDNRLATILICRYINSDGWKIVADKVDLAVGTVMGLHIVALDLMIPILENNRFS